MSIYYGNYVQKLATGPNCIYSKMKWHSSYSLLAMATMNETSGSEGTVSICHDQGELLEEVVIQRPVVVQDMQWHPEKKLLATGWANGEITISNIGMGEVHEHGKVHTTSIATLTWSSRGGHLLTSDESGLVIVWRLEPRGQLHTTPVHQNQLMNRPTHCVMIRQSESSDRPLHSKFQSNDSIECFIAVETGTLYFMTSNGQCVESEKIATGFRHLKFSEESSLLVGITEKLLLMVFSVDSRGNPNRVFEGKLNAQGQILSAVWCPEGTVATCSHEPCVRFWDCVNNENYLLNLKDYINYSEDTFVVDISYSNSCDLLACATNSRQVAIWKREPHPSGDNWIHVTTFGAPGDIGFLEWSGNRNLLAINDLSGIQILSKRDVSAVHKDGVSAVQVSPTEVVIQSRSADSFFVVETDLVFNGLAVSKDHLAVWNESTVAVYTILFDKSMARQTAKFTSCSCSAAIHELNVYTVESDKLIARNTQGVVKHKLPIGGDLEEDSVASLHVSGRHLVLVMKQGTLRIWDLARREPKLIFGKNLSQLVPRFGEVIQAQANATASRITVTILNDNDLVVVAVVNPAKDSLKLLDFSKVCKEDSEEGPGLLRLPPNLAPNVREEQASLAYQLEHAHILNCHWDTVDSRLLLVEFQRDMRLKRTSSRRHSKQGPEMMLLTLFITENMDVLLQNIVNIDPEYSRSVGCEAPCVYFLKKKLHIPQRQLGLDSSTNSDSHMLYVPPIERSPLGDFVGLEDCDPPTIKAIMNFSYYSAIGNMDEAFKSIKVVKSQKVWESLARMCVKSQRLDVALVCLGNMGSARAAKAVREAQELPELEARLAVLATQLGMTDEAENLYRASGRYDLLNMFYQASGRWQKAIEIAEVNDRMHLKSTYFNFAKHSEALGEIKPALRSYERSDAPSEVTRMLMDEPDELEEYVLSSRDNEVKHFWAEYLESVDDLEGAMHQYEGCGDIHSQVRILQLLGDIQRAVEVVEKTRDKSAAYYLAQHLSHSDQLSDIRQAIQFFTLAHCYNPQLSDIRQAIQFFTLAHCYNPQLSDIRQAIQFFTLAHCYNPALQLAKDNGLDMELMNLALMSTREDKMEAAQFYETNPDTQDKAIMLYHKAGELSKALELCFQYRQYDVLQLIAEELSEGCNPDTLRKVTNYFVEQEQFDKAVDLLIRSNEVSMAIELCHTHHVVISEELAKRMTPEKVENETQEQSEKRAQLLDYLGDCLVDQGQWHLATKKYTQSGNRIKGMKALLKSGDTKKIVYFANVSREKEIYIMAANYLQSLDWRGNPDIMKNIIGFYTKGRALESLANFYDMCAQVEIDEYQDYDKAYGALNEAVKCLRKDKNQGRLEEKIQFFLQRANLIKKFADARNSYSSNPEQCIWECHSLLEDSTVDTAVRAGDIYGVLVTHYAHQQQYKEAYDLIQEMCSRIPGVNMEFYIDQAIISTVYTAQGFEPPPSTDRQEDNEVGSEEEEVAEDFEVEP